MQWMTLFRKEMLENWRNFKWVWVPLVIILLAIIDPITNYYLPLIIESTGGLPEGTNIDMPTPLPSDAVMMSLGQFSSLGVIVIVLMSMGAIAGERKSGVIELVLVKPVSYRNYITSKWVTLLLIVWSSLLLGLIASWYYVNLLFGEFSFISLLQVVFFYGLWFTLVITISIFYNTLVKTPGLVGALTIITTILMSIVTSVFGHILTWSPIHLSTYIHDMITLNKISLDLIATSGVTLLFIGIFLFAAIFTFRTKELAD